MPLSIFVSFGVTLDPAETPFAKTPFSQFLIFRDSGPEGAGRLFWNFSEACGPEGLETLIIITM